MEASFEKWWPDLEEGLRAAQSISPEDGSPFDPLAAQKEILSTVRSIQRTLPELRRSSSYRSDELSWFASLAIERIANMQEIPEDVKPALAVLSRLVSPRRSLYERRLNPANQLRLPEFKESFSNLVKGNYFLDSPVTSALGPKSNDLALLAFLLDELSDSGGEGSDINDGQNFVLNRDP